MGLIILCLLVYIPGLWTIPPVDRDESRFAQASRQMLESGTLEGWVVPRVQDKPRLNKPPLIYWAQATSAAILGDAPGQWAWLDGGSENIWVYRVPSVLGAIATVLMTWRLGARMFDPRAGWLAAALLAVCPIVVWDAHQARADQLLLALTTATMFSLWRLWSRTPRHAADEALRIRGSGWSITFWLFLSLGIMAKGPITPMIAGLTCVTLSVVSREWRWLRRLRPVMGVVIVLAAVSPWVYLVGHEVGWSKYLKIVYDETIGRSAGAKEGHWGPPGYHIVLLGVLFWPGSLLTAAAIGRAWRRGMRRQDTSLSRDRKGASACEQVGGADPRQSVSSDFQQSGSFTPYAESTVPDRTTAVRSGAPRAPLRSRLRRVWESLRDARPSRRAELFLLAWMLPSWVVFELVSTKLPHYTMPLYPAVALISARMLLSLTSMRPRFRADEENREHLFGYLASEHPKCPKCRYDLHGVDRDMCPECGTAIALGSDWRKSRIWGGKGDTRRVVIAGESWSQRMGEGIWWTIGAGLTLVVPGALTVFSTVQLDPTGSSITSIVSLHLKTLIIIATGIIAAVSLPFLACSLRHLRELRPLAATFRAMVALVVAFMGLFFVLLPASDYLWVSNRIVAVIRHRDPHGTIPLVDAGYFEDSLVFLTRGRVLRITDADTLCEFLKSNPVEFVITESPNNLLEAVLNTMRTYDNFEVKMPFSDWVSGYNYSKGEPASPWIHEIHHE
jgi:4-amino-4-deoxy-L-arabinose transferase-like glycosyltransferase